jgi:uncharacterized damage-inducible protein DinB
VPVRVPGASAKTAMTTTSLLVKEFTHEAATTRRMLERLPGDKLEWRPHAKSFTAIGLASHIVECLGWTETILTQDDLDIDPATYRPYHATSVAGLLERFDDRVAAGQRALATVTDADLDQEWAFKIMGRERWKKPKAAVIRDFTLSHLIHHRGQLSVYLRLLDVPVPGAYGPTADDKK